MLTRRFVVVAALMALLVPAGGKSTAQGGGARVPIDVLLSSDRASARLGDSIVLTTKVKNVSDDSVFLYGKLRWGPSSSLFLLITDDNGKSVPMGYFEDALPPTPSTSDKTLFIKLEPQHFFGVSRTDKVSDLVPKPGAYTFQVVYRGPVPRRFAAGKPAWGTEDPSVLSNKIRIEIQ